MFSRTSRILIYPYLDKNGHRFNVIAKNLTTAVDKDIRECYNILNVPPDSKQDVVKTAFLELAKKYHPDSGSPEANIDMFVAVESAFRILTKYNTGKSCSDDVQKIVYDIKHTAPQHRQYLSYEGAGHGTPSQRMKQWEQTRAQQAAENVLEHRLAKSKATEKSIMKKGYYGKKHDIKTKYGFDRLVEDLIQESMSKGEFENLSGKGKPLNYQNRNPYVDFTTHKLNEVLINNGFTPEWITMNKEIDQDIEALRKEIENDRKILGPYPLGVDDSAKWSKICAENKELANSINMKINKYNLIVPLLNKQRFHVDFEKIVDDVLKNGQHSFVHEKVASVGSKSDSVISNEKEDLILLLVKAFTYVFSYNKEEKKKDVQN